MLMCSIGSGVEACSRTSRFKMTTSTNTLGDSGNSLPVSVALTAAGIPGADLSEPLESHGVQALQWWLLCRGIKNRAVRNSEREREIDREIERERESQFAFSICQESDSYRREGRSH